MKILVTFAVNAEFAPWRRRHAFHRVFMPAPVGLPGSFFYRGTVFDHHADVLLTGMGWEERKTENWPRYALRQLLKNQPDLCVSSGLAGGLRADLRCGDIAAATEVSLRTAGETFPSNVNLLAIAKGSGARIDTKQVTEPGVVSAAPARSALSAFGDFVDMEGYYILRMVSETRTPAISVRAISDTRDRELPPEIAMVVNREGHVQALPTLKLILKRPTRIPALLSFASQCRDAAISLADFLDRFLQAAAGGDKSEAQAKGEEVAAR
jgi:nucleoside phosphorylase